jgi:hypothetical protein
MGWKDDYGRGSVTRLGRTLCVTVQAAVWAFDYALPLTGISAYRLIPDARRGKLFGGESSSLDAVRALRMAGGGGWQIIKAAIKDNGGEHPDR